MEGNEYPVGLHGRIFPHSLAHDYHIGIVLVVVHFGARLDHTAKKG